ncbi:MAG TPA: hypothetical protein VJ742_12655 [Nitrososphaera sp.]|nr:hypothetical protein [Nitrososphaera sp.]
MRNPNVITTDNSANKAEETQAYNALDDAVQAELRSDWVAAVRTNADTAWATDALKRYQDLRRENKPISEKFETHVKAAIRCCRSVGRRLDYQEIRFGGGKTSTVATGKKKRKTHGKKFGYGEGKEPPSTKSRLSAKAAKQKSKK